MDPQDALNRRAQVEEFQRRHHTRLVTMLFSDIVGSTRLKQIVGDRNAIGAIQRHHAVFREILNRFVEAEEVSTAGDSFFIVFAKPSDAVKFSLLVQAGLRHLAKETGHPVLDRIGIHVGEVWVDETATPGKSKDLYGIQVDTCARVSSLGGADQILLTRFVFDSARQVIKGEEIGNLAPLSWLNHGPYLMKGIEEPLEVCEVGETGKATLDRPADTETAHHFLSADSEPVLGWRPAVDQPVPGTSWVLERKLGEGGFGEVWLGRDKVLKTHHVFKFCFRADRVRSLKREVTLFRLLKEHIGVHPNIVTVEATYFDEPPFYIVMQYVDDRVLPAWCEAQGGIECVPLATRLEIVSQAADALQAAHDSGVIHRDVKPSNILVGGNSNADPRVRLTDFGIGQIVSEEALAGATSSGFTQTIMDSASRSGTQLYMAPELFAGKAASIRSDIYALGVVLYQLLTGDFTRPVTTDWARQITEPLLREDLEKCFAGDPQERFAGAGQLASQLRSMEQRRTAVTEQHAVVKAKEQAAYRRGILRTAAVAGAVIALVASLAIYSFRSAQIARQLEQRAERSAKAEAIQRENAERSAKAEVIQRENAERSAKAEVIQRENARRSADAEAIQRQRTEEQTKRAEAAATQVQLNLSQSFFLQALHSIEEGRRPDALAELARSLSANPRNDAALCRLATLLQYQSLAFPVLSLRHDGPVRSAQFSPDGKRIVTVSEDDTARIWDAQTGKLLVEPLKHNGVVRMGQFSPDGRWIVTASSDKTARVWDAQTGKQLIEPLNHRGPVWSAQFSPDGKWIATASWDKTAQVWNAENGKPLPQPLKHDGRVWSAQFSPDGKSIVSASSDKTARVWDAQTAKQLIEPLKHRGTVWSAQFSPDGKSIVTASDDNTGRVWDAQTGRALTEPLKHDGAVLMAQFSPDGKRVVTASDDNTARVWDARTGKLLAEPLKHDSAVVGAQFSPNGKRIVTASWVKIARVWGAENGKPLTEPLNHDGAVLAAQFSPDGERVLTASDDNTARIWDISPGGKIAPEWLPRLAEAVAGQKLNDYGVFEPLNEDPTRLLEEIRAQLSSAPLDDNWAIWGRWFLSDRSTRTISPFSTITVSEYIESLIRENTSESIDEAESLAVGNMDLLKHIGHARTQATSTDPREAKLHKTGAAIPRLFKYPPQPASLLPQKPEEGVLFQCYAPGARVIYLAGDFNNWANNHDGGYITDRQFAMQGPDEKGVWRKVVKLAPGKHLFRFNFNGEPVGWFTPDSIEDRDANDHGIFTVTERGDVVVHRKPE